LLRAEADGARAARRLSSGLRIATAADDPAGLARAERLHNGARSQDAAVRSIDHAVGLVRGADVVLEKLYDLHVEIDAINVRLANHTLSREDRALLRRTQKRLRRDIRQTVRSAEHDGVQLFRRGRTLGVQVGPEAGDVIELRLRNLRSLGRQGRPTKAALPDGPRPDRPPTIEEGMELLLRYRGEFGALLNRLQSARRTATSLALEGTRAESRIRDVDFAVEVAQLARAELLRRSGTAVLAQANVQGVDALRLLVDLP
jgi:flagellin